MTQSPERLYASGFAFFSSPKTAVSSADQGLSAQPNNLFFRPYKSFFVHLVQTLRPKHTPQPGANE